MASCEIDECCECCEIDECCKGRACCDAFRDEDKRYEKCYVVLLDIFRDVLSLPVWLVPAIFMYLERKYLGIVDNDFSYTLIFILQIVLGAVTFILSVTKSVASACFSSLSCHYFTLLLSTVLFVLTALSFPLGIITAIKSSSGNAIEISYFESATQTFLDYNTNTQTQWDDFQSTFECCGVSGPSDYVRIFNQFNIVPESCCNHQMLSSQNIDCSDVAANVSTEDLVANMIYNQGCVDAVISEVTINYIIAAIILIGFALVSLQSLVPFCIVTIWKLGVSCADKDLQKRTTTVTTRSY